MNERCKNLQFDEGLTKAAAILLPKEIGAKHVQTNRVSDYDEETVGVPLADDTGKHQMRILPDSVRKNQPTATRSIQYLDGSRKGKRVGHPNLRSTNRLKNVRQCGRKSSTESNGSTRSRNCGNNTAYKWCQDTSSQKISKQQGGSLVGRRVGRMVLPKRGICGRHCGNDNFTKSSGTMILDLTEGFTCENKLKLNAQATGPTGYKRGTHKWRGQTI